MPEHAVQRARALDRHRAPRPVPICPPARPLSRVLISAFAATTWLLSAGPDLFAQGVTTASIRGTVGATGGTDPDGTRVTVRNMATGFVVRAEVRHGRFVVQGLEVGGPYTITLERLGLRRERRDGVYLTLGEPLELNVVMRPAAIVVEPLHVSASAPFARANAHGGTATTVGDSLLHRLPTLNRNLYDFVHLAPQVSTRIGFGPEGMSGGGVGFRFNNFLIDGVPERSISSNQPPEFAAGKSLPFEAVREYQVLLAPFDVRYGDYAGALVNAVTKSGTNEFRGSAFAYWRNDALARRNELAAAPPHERLLYGFSLGGPIRRDRAHFFVATELQRLTSPAPGPFVGQPEEATPPVPVAETHLARLEGIMEGYGLEAGSGGPVTNRNPLANVFARLDLGVPEWASRAVLWGNASRTRSFGFSRPSRGVFPLSTHAATLAFGVRSGGIRLHTTLPRTAGGHNELLASYRSLRAEVSPEVQQPVVRVGVPGTTGGAVTVVAGTPAVAQGGESRFWNLNLRENLTLPVGASHVATLGFQAEWFHADPFPPGVPNAFGTWTFASLDSLGTGRAERFERARDFGSAEVPISGGYYALYAGDRWRAGERFTVTLGLRAETMTIGERAPYNPVVDSVFGRRTDVMPDGRLHLSPRVGFTWDPGGAGRDQLRGGVGVFTGRPPLAWIHLPLRQFGIGIGVLRCGSLSGDLGPPPPFEPDQEAAPAACRDGSGLASPPRGDVELLDGRLRMAQTLRGVLAYDRRLPWDLLGTVEALITRNVSDFVFTNLNLGDPRATDPYGRVMYGTIDPAGVARPAVRDTSLPSVVELRNTSRNHSLQLSARLEKRFSRGIAGVASYTYSRVRDVQTPLRINTPGFENWSSRAVSGRHEDLSAGVSLNDVPHRVVLAGTYRAPWRRWTTELSFSYVGESGSPFAYLAWGAGERGDLNADGSDENDPIYMPRSASDPEEILFSGQSNEPGADNSPTAQAERVSRQREAFERFIEATPCLERRRGRILERNACREPWTHTTLASVRQAIPLARGALELQLDIFNLLNLLNRDWGHRRIAPSTTDRGPRGQLLEHVGQTPEPVGESRPIFRFDEAAPRWATLPVESAFQLQLGVRYRF